MILIPTILCGGAGSRLWPLSRYQYPKPFITLFGDQSLLQNTAKRALALPYVEEIVTVTHDDLLFLALEQYEGIVPDTVNQHFILEPEGRDTAGAAIAAALHIQAQFGDGALMLLMPADHMIEGEDALYEAVISASELAYAGKIVLFGIKPHSAATKFGYIEADGHLIKRFIEKPDHTMAEKYIADGQYFWNSGMMCAEVGSFLKAVQQHCGEMLEIVRRSLMLGSIYDDAQSSRTLLHQDHYRHIEKISIDYALLEKAENLAFVACDFSWSDMGTWSAISDAGSKDMGGNSVSHHSIAGDTLLIETRNTHIQTHDRMVATIGVDDLLIVDTPDALLVSHKDHDHQVKEAFQDLLQQGHQSAEKPNVVHRPWGLFTTLQESAMYKVKRIEVKPHATLSLQSHQYRSEHWVVVAGTATIINGIEQLKLNVGQSTYIERRTKHRLSNLSDDPLIIIEVQTGDYLGEDDITRYEDAYGRSSAA